MNTSDETKGVIAALAKAHKDFKSPTKDQPGQARGAKYFYADLGAVLEAITEPLAKNGLIITQATCVDESGFNLATRLWHDSGEWIEAVYPLPLGANSQELGSAITYGRRYSIMALLNLTAEDDDGAQASTPVYRAEMPSQPPSRPAPTHTPASGGNAPRMISDAQRKRLFAIGKKAGATEAQVKSIVLKVTGQEHTAQIPAGRAYDTICEMVERKQFGGHLETAARDAGAVDADPWPEEAE